jgi:hypothetical protein
VRRRRANSDRELDAERDRATGKEVEELIKEK